VAGLLCSGAIAVVAGYLWGRVFPINKSLWTSSYVLFSGGAALLLLGWFYWIVDVVGWKAWATPFVAYGMNAIAVFVASGLLAKQMALSRVEGGTVPVKTWIYETVYASWAGPTNGSLLFALTYVLFWLAVMWFLYSKRVFIKI
jgi:predicted acyltransferase